MATLHNNTNVNENNSEAVIGYEPISSLIPETSPSVVSEEDKHYEEGEGGEEDEEEEEEEEGEEITTTETQEETTEKKDKEEETQQEDTGMVSADKRGKGREPSKDKKSDRGGKDKNKDKETDGNNKEKNNNKNGAGTGQQQQQPQPPKEGLQDLITSKIAELENGSAKEDEEERKIAKVVKRHMQDVKQAMDSISSPEERFKSLNAKYMQLYHENRRQDKELQNLKRKNEQAGKDKDTIHSELTKVNNMKTKLEALCRELQRQNKQVLEDSKRVAADEQQKRQDLSKKFHTTIKEITAKMEEQGDERLKQLKENEMLREKLKNFAEQYEIREQHFATQMKAKDLERQLLEAKLKQQADIALQEALKAQAYKEQIATLAKTENELRAQLALYAEKFEQFQDTLTKSNDVFTTFKQEMERMTKSIKRLEKENGGLKKKTEQTDITLIDLAEERNNYRKQVETLKTQKQKLEGLCRALQAERQSSSPAQTPTTESTAPPTPVPAIDKPDVPPSN